MYSSEIAVVRMDGGWMRQVTSGETPLLDSSRGTWVHRKNLEI